MNNWSIPRNEISWCWLKLEHEKLGNDDVDDIKWGAAWMWTFTLFSACNKKDPSKWSVEICNNRARLKDRERLTYCSLLSVGVTLHGAHTTGAK